MFAGCFRVYFVIVFSDNERALTKINDEEKFINNSQWSR